jgi:DNA polymerase-1
MIAAFEAGGDFHSRTAMAMYPHVAAAVDKGAVLLEWDDAAGKAAPAPLLKNVFANERRKAKILNFSIAYGKTALGLSRDWNVSLAEAKDTVAKWYADRPEVREWQQRVIADARRHGATRTLLGRYRDLPDINSRDIRRRAHAERAAINTPIQGSAADVAMGAMLKLWRDDELARLGWRMVLQVHDEIILEGPEAHAEAAMARVHAGMAHPFDRSLLVELAVDAKACGSWYDGK